MNRKSSGIILSVILIISFFLPFVSSGLLSFSGFNIVFGKNEVAGLISSGNALFVSLLIPIGALFVLIGTVTKDSFSSSGIVRWMPLIGVAYIIVMLYLQATGSGGVSMGELIGYFDYGLWMALVAAIILPFTRG